MLQKTLHLPVVKRDVSIDFWGAGLITGGVSVLLIWVSLAGHEFDWLSLTTAWMVGLGVVLLAAAVHTESRVREPIIPLRLFRDRTTSLSVFASVMVGLAMFGSTVFLSQYFQIARGMSPTRAGLMSLALVGGLLVSSIATGRIISASGLWKRYLVGGTSMMVVGLLLLGTIDAHTSLWVVGAFMAVLGLGMGATMQNLVLAVQNNAAQSDIGAASSLVAFFRTMGGSIGVSVLGAILGHRVSDSVPTGLARLGVPATSEGASRAIPDMAALPAPVRAVFEDAFGAATGHIFLVAAPFALLALVAVLFIREVPLRTTIERQDELEELRASRPPRDRGEGAAATDAARAGTTRALRDIERELGVLLHRVRRRTAENAQAVDPGLQPAAYPVLLYVVEHEGVRAAAIVDHFGIDKGAVSRHVGHLEALGLVTRSCDPDDRRAQVLVATATGQERVRSLQAERRRVFADRLSDWSEEELADLAGRLARYNAALGG